MTIPQILVLNHAAWCNKERSDERLERKRGKDDAKAALERERNEADPIVWRGKRLGEMTSDEMMAYYTDM